MPVPLVAGARVEHTWPGCWPAEMVQLLPFAVMLKTEVASIADWLYC